MPGLKMQQIYQKWLIIFYQGVEYLSCVIDIFTKYAWVKSLNDKKS